MNLVSPQARDIALVKNKNQQFHAADDKLPRESEFGICFFSARALERAEEIRESAKILGNPDPTFLDCENLAIAAGPYALDDGLAATLRRRGLKLGSEGQVPYTAALERISLATYSALDKKKWRVAEIREFFIQNEIHLCGWSLDIHAEKILRVILHASPSNLPCWDALEALDALDCHRSHSFLLRAKRSTTTNLPT